MIINLARKRQRERTDMKTYVNGTEGNEYKDAGLNYELIQPFKDRMVEVGKMTRNFPNRRDVYIVGNNPVLEYRGGKPHCWKTMLEGLGNKDWIAQWMYQFGGTGKTYFDAIAVDGALMGVNDILATGALPVGYHDEVVAKTSEWFNDQKRAEDYARGLYEVCRLCGMALIGGESPAYRFLLGAAPPVSDTPSCSCAVFGIIAPASRRINEENLHAGDVIIGATSSGWHSNGATYIIEQAMKLPDGFNTKLPDGRTLGEHALIPTRSYVALMGAWLEAELDIHAFQPITGDGVAKIAFDKRPFTYRIKNWPKKIPMIFAYMREQFGLSAKGSLKTFNNGIGAVGFFPRSAFQKAMEIGEKAGYEMHELGVVEEGKRQTIFGPENNLVLPPPGE